MSNTDDVIIAKRILRYLENNPGTKETLEGIAEWWLLQGKISEAVDQVAHAVAWLVTRGYLQEKTFTGAQIFYEINPAKRHEIEIMLKSEPDASRQIP